MCKEVRMVLLLQKSINPFFHILADIVPKQIVVSNVQHIHSAYNGQTVFNPQIIVANFGANIIGVFFIEVEKYYSVVADFFFLVFLETIFFISAHISYSSISTMS